MINLANVNNTTMNGNSGNDVLIGGTLVDTLVDGAGNDILVGRTGGDTLTGGTPVLPARSSGWLAIWQAAASTSSPTSKPALVAIHTGPDGIADEAYDAADRASHVRFAYSDNSTRLASDVTPATGPNGAVTVQVESG